MPHTQIHRQVLHTQKHRHRYTEATHTKSQMSHTRIHRQTDTTHTQRLTYTTHITTQTWHTHTHHTHRYTDSHADRQTDKHTYTHIHIQTHTLTNPDTTGNPPPPPPTHTVTYTAYTPHRHKSRHNKNKIQQLFHLFPHPENPHIDANCFCFLSSSLLLKWCTFWEKLTFWTAPRRKPLRSPNGLFEAAVELVWPASPLSSPGGLFPFPPSAPPTLAAFSAFSSTVFAAGGSAAVDESDGAGVAVKSDDAALESDRSSEPLTAPARAQWMRVV